MAERDPAERVLKVRAETERLKAEVARGEMRFEAAEQKVAEVHRQLKERGYDLAGDLQRQVEQRAQQLEVDAAALRTDVVALQDAAG